jgi:hypothetical protein
MSIPLPEAAWWVRMTPECDFSNSPLGKDFNKYNLGIHEEFPELYVDGSFDGKKLKADPRVLEVEAVWYITPFQFTRPHAEVDGLEIHSYFGKCLGNCLGQARVYTTRSEALADLATCDRGVGWVVAASKVRKGSAGRREALFARCVNAADYRTALAVLSGLAKLRGLLDNEELKGMAMRAAEQEQRIKELEERLAGRGPGRPSFDEMKRVARAAAAEFYRSQGGEPRPDMDPVAPHTCSAETRPGGDNPEPLAG